MPLIKKSFLSKENFGNYQPGMGLFLSNMAECVVAAQIRSYMDSNDQHFTKLDTQLKWPCYVFKPRYIYVSFQGYAHSSCPP